MEPLFPRIRKPVEREGAERYLLFTLLSFALSVSLTRLFLDLTGYPQIGGGTLHIAHVLWGGLLLFIAALLPILYVNRWVYMADAMIAGAGVGLFIDEVGKFITRSNDYFYPPAAPIIYAFFLLTVLLYLEIRKPHKLDARSDLYAVLEDLEEVLDQDLSDRERARILDRLNRIQSGATNPDYVRLAGALQEYINAETIYLVPHKPGFVERCQNWFARFESGHVNRGDIRIVLAVTLLAMGSLELLYPFRFALHASSQAEMAAFMRDLVRSGLVHSQTALAWFEIRLGLQLVVGLTLVVSAILFFANKDRRAAALSYLGLLLALTSVNLLVFYFDQFSTIVSAVAELFVLLVVIYYRRRYFGNLLLAPHAKSHGRRSGRFSIPFINRSRDIRH
jgi:hypothetical protein